jgi:succinate dehydrogenase/fumarate reductase flavoprotein subunit
VTRVLTGPDGQVAAVMGFDCRTAELCVIRTKAAVICTGAAGRLGLPASGYLMGTYENPTNCGDGHAMAFHAGADLANLECFQINPLIKDYNGPACAYVTGPLGGYTANAKGERFIECDYWSGQMMQEFYNELQSGNGPVFLGPAAAASTRSAATTTAARWSRCTSPRSASAAGTAHPESTSTHGARPR